MPRLNFSQDTLPVPSVLSHPFPSNGSSRIPPLLSIGCYPCYQKGVRYTPHNAQSLISIYYTITSAVPSTVTEVP